MASLKEFFQSASNSAIGTAIAPAAPGQMVNIRTNEKISGFNGTAIAWNSVTPGECWIVRAEDQWWAISIHPETKSESVRLRHWKRPKKRDTARCPLLLSKKDEEKTEFFLLEEGELYKVVNVPNKVPGCPFKLPNDPRDLPPGSKVSLNGKEYRAIQYLRSSNYYPVDWKGMARVFPDVIDVEINKGFPFSNVDVDLADLPPGDPRAISTVYGGLRPPQYLLLGPEAFRFQWRSTPQVEMQKILDLEKPAYSIRNHMYTIWNGQNPTSSLGPLPGDSFYVEIAVVLFSMEDTDYPPPPSESMKLASYSPSTNWTSENYDTNWITDDGWEPLPYQDYTAPPGDPDLRNPPIRRDPPPRDNSYITVMTAMLDQTYILILHTPECNSTKFDKTEIFQSSPEIDVSWLTEGDDRLNKISELQRFPVAEEIEEIDEPLKTWIRIASANYLEEQTYVITDSTGTAVIDGVATRLDFSDEESKEVQIIQYEYLGNGLKGEVLRESFSIKPPPLDFGTEYKVEAIAPIV